MKTSKVTQLRPTTYDVRFDGVITALTMIHLTSPSVKSKEEKGVILIPVMERGTMLLKAGIHGETLRGGLRRASEKLAERILADRTGSDENPFDMKQYYRLTIGGVKGNEAQRADDVFMLDATFKRNPIAKLFGGAEPYWMAGAFGIGIAVAQQSDAQQTLKDGTRKDDLTSNPELLASFSVADQELWLSYSETTKDNSIKKKEIKALGNAIRALKKPKNGAPIDNEKIAELQKELAELNALVEDKAKTPSKLSTNTIGRPLPGVNCIVAGSELDHHMRVRGVTAQQLGFLLETIRLWAEEFTIGGKDNTCYGQFKAEYVVKVRERKRIVPGPWTQIGTMQLSEDEVNFPEHPVIETAFAGFEDLSADASVDFGYSQVEGSAKPDAEKDEDED